MICGTMRKKREWTIIQNMSLKIDNNDFLLQDGILTKSLFLVSAMHSITGYQLLLNAKGKELPASRRS